MAEPHEAPGEDADDVEAVEAWCRGCDEVRTFSLRHVDYEDAQLARSTRNVRRALETAPAWVCGACSAVRFRLADEEHGRASLQPTGPRIAAHDPTRC